MKEKNLKFKVYKSIRMLLIFLCVMTLFLVKVKAEESAVFHVQSADVKEDGTIDVIVYLTGASNLGGIDAELVYDPMKVLYVDGQLGKSLKSEYSDVYHNEEKSLIKYIVLYPKAQDAHGAFMKATFQLKEGESYQPELNVVDIVDDSDEIKDISYKVTYQQADGTWNDVQDTSGKKADKMVIAESLESYGSDTDKKEAAKKSNLVDQNTIGNGATDSNSVDDGKIEQNEPETAGVMGNYAQDLEKTLDESADPESIVNGQAQDGTFVKSSLKSNKVAFAIAGIVIAVVVIVLICLAVRKKKKAD